MFIRKTNLYYTFVLKKKAFKTNHQNNKYLTFRDIINFLHTKSELPVQLFGKVFHQTVGGHWVHACIAVFLAKEEPANTRKTTFPKESSNSTAFNLTRAVLYHKWWPSTLPQKQQQKWPALTDQTITFFYQIPKCGYMHINKAKSPAFWDVCHQTPCCPMVADAGKSSAAGRESCTHSSPWLLGAEWEGGKAPVPTLFCGEEQNKSIIIRVVIHIQKIMFQSGNSEFGTCASLIHYF